MYLRASFVAVFTSALLAVGAVAAQELQTNFTTNWTLQEAGSMAESPSPVWWLNSGGYLFSENGTGHPVIGDLPTNDPWRLAYAASNPLDTDGGYHPQNIFRLVTKGRWDHFLERVYFKIGSIVPSASPNRSASNGVLLFNRYQDANNLYYAGVRVDGTAVIKKKISGKYYTMAQTKVFPGTYDSNLKNNLIPVGHWYGIRTIVETNSDGSVTVSLYLDHCEGQGWQLVLEAVDTGASIGPPIRSAGSGGVRTDFLNVYLGWYRIAAIQ